MKLIFPIILIQTTINPCYAIDYSTAFNNAKNAFLIQSGVQDNINKFGQYGLSQLKYYGLENEFGAVAFSYRVYRDKAGSISLGSGKRLTINLNGATLSLPINWH